METTALGYRVTLPGDFDEVLAKAKDALKAEGFGVLTEIDVKDTLQKKIGAEFRQYRILGACNPNLAHRALQTNLEVGLLLPCNAIVYDDGQGVTVEVMRPTAMLAASETAGLETVASEAEERIRRAVEALEGGQQLAVSS